MGECFQVDVKYKSQQADNGDGLIGFNGRSLTMAAINAHHLFITNDQVTLTDEADEQQSWL